MKNNVTKCTLEQYIKKYRNRRYKLLKFTKKEVEAFDKKYQTSDNYLLKANNRKWALIGDTYYQIPKAPSFTWFRNLNAACQIGTCVLAAGVVAAAVTVPVVMLNRNVGDSDEVKAAKILAATKATSKKVTELSKKIGNVDFAKQSRSNVSEITYEQSTQKNYCAEQSFGFYIFNNIEYALNNFYGTGDVKTGTVITGKTRQVPDLDLIKIYNGEVPGVTLPDTTLSAKVDISNVDGKTVVDFNADWNFENDKWGSNDRLPKAMNSTILTNGRMIHNPSTGNTEKLIINYYWTGIHRSFASFTMNYLEDKFYYIDGGGLDDITLSSQYDRWDYQTKVGKNATVHDVWNNGTLTPDNLLDYKYYVFEAFVGKINDFSETNVDGYKRTQDHNSLVNPTEVTTDKDKWEAKIVECYNANKELKLRNESDKLNLSNAKEVNIDMCPKYGEVKTTLYWIYSGDPLVYSGKSVIPFREKDELLEDFNKVAIKVTEDDKKELINKAKNVLSKIDDKNYLCQFTDNDLSFKFNIDKGQTTQDYNYNCYKVVGYNYEIKEGSNSVKYYYDTDGILHLVE